MASLDGSRFDITGASGSQGLLGPKSSWRAYILPRGGHAAQDSTGTLITFDSADVASRYAANDWIQAGLSVDNIRQVSAVGGDSLSVSGAALTVSANDRIFLIGTTQPTVTGGSATYTTPETLVRQRDDDAASLFANSMITTNSQGLVQFWAATNFYDCIIQDGNQTNQASVVDLPLGSVGGVSATGAALFGETVTVNGALGVTGWAFFGSTVTMHAALGVTGWATFGSSVTMDGALGVTGTASVGALESSTSPVFNVKHPDYGAKGDGSTDDSTAIQLAIDAAGTANGGVVFFPDGVYIINATLELKTGVRLIGVTATPGKSDGTALKLKNSANVDIIRSDTSQDGAAENHWTGIENMNIDGNKANNTSGDGVSVGGRTGENFIIHRCLIRDTADHGVNLTRGSNGLAIFDGIHFFNCGSDGVESGFFAIAEEGIDSFAPLYLNNISGDNNGRALIHIDFDAHSGLVHISNVKAEHNTASRQDDAILLDNGNNRPLVSIDSVFVITTTDTTNAAIRIITGDIRVKWSNVFAQSPGTTNIFDDEVNSITVVASVTGSADASSGQNFDLPLQAGFSVAGNITGSSSIIFEGTSNTNLNEAATLTVPQGYFFGISSTGTSISNMTQTTGREVMLWAAAGTFGFSESNALSVMGSSINSINITEGNAVKGFCTGTTWFIFAPSFGTPSA